MKKDKKACAKREVRNRALNITAISMVIFTIAFIPLVVRLRIIENPSNALPDAYDFFAFWKSWALYIAAIVAVIPLFYGLKKFFQNKSHLERGQNKENIVLLALTGIYIITCIISTILSSNLSVSLFGYRCQNEGLFTIVSVFIIMACGLLYSDKFKRDWIYKIIYISANIIFILGIFQFFGLDPFKTEFIKSIIIPNSYEELANGILYPDSSSFRNSIYSTLYNSNVFGTYSAIIMVFTLSKAIFIENKKQMILPLFTMSLSLFSLLNCYSRGAYLGAAVGTIVIVLMALKKIKIYYKSFISVFICMAIVLGTTLILGNGKFMERLSTVYINTQDTAAGITERINDFTVNKNKLTLRFNNNSLNIEKRYSNLVFSDTYGLELTLDYSPDDEGYVINRDNYRDFIVFADKENLYIKKQNALLRFIIKENTFLLADLYGKEAKMKEVLSGLFTGKERFASGRGYIWSRTIPLVKNYIAVGSGPDTFYYAFQQDDYIGKLKFMYNAYVNIDMAHNMFLQKAIETGGLSMLIFILIILWILFSAFRKKNVSILAITVVYCICGLFTDENICTMIVFWPLIGIEFPNMYSSNMKDYYHH
ncbi:O-antigen ligase family protein [Pseudobacteroides cellulosolvens]|uniref:O-antigen polymerase n=1 Tax=Pseudobacteroides cellulosolvens ATCC 35603 = DSM 2933 TaxID=398512 RepID=A0A0L6JJU0_9FIRM|nr:O-antigen ligase family protein [Pseudobacteroides cellulosolvens]KNY26029.1 O-antigen polymerase [Pseudobacteroides cellulosolvens ATCC 35603 = DSM 2933]